MNLIDIRKEIGYHVDINNIKYYLMIDKLSLSINLDKLFWINMFNINHLPNYNCFNLKELLLINRIVIRSFDIIDVIMNSSYYTIAIIPSKIPSLYKDNYVDMIIIWPINNQFKLFAMNDEFTCTFYLFTYKQIQNLLYDILYYKLII